MVILVGGKKKNPRKSKGGHKNVCTPTVFFCPLKVINPAPGSIPPTAVFGGRLSAVTGLAQCLKVIDPIRAAVFSRNNVVDFRCPLVASLGLAIGLPRQDHAAKLAPPGAVPPPAADAAPLIVAPGFVALVVGAKPIVGQAWAPGHDALFRRRPGQGASPLDVQISMEGVRPHNDVAPAVIWPPLAGIEYPMVPLQFGEAPHHLVVVERACRFDFPCGHAIRPPDYDVENDPVVTVGEFPGPSVRVDRRVGVVPVVRQAFVE